MPSGDRSKAAAWSAAQQRLPRPPPQMPHTSDRIFDAAGASPAFNAGDLGVARDGPKADIARRAAHRGYTQKSREKVNARFNELLAVLPPLPSNHAIPRSKAGILDYAIEHAQLLRSSVAALEIKVALSSPEELATWFSKYTAGACTIREVAQPILDLFCIGMGWTGAEGWALDADGASASYFKQAWTHLPSSDSLEYRRQGRRNEAEALSKYELAAARNEQSERNSLLESFFATGSNLLIPASRSSCMSIVQSSGEPSYISAPVQSAAQNPSDQLLSRITFAANGTLKCAAARVSAVLTVPLCMYGRVQMVLMFYGTEPMKYDTHQDMYSAAAENTAKRIAEITLARYCLPSNNPS